MPNSIATVTVFALAIVPGAFGVYAWALLNGQDWREKEWEAGVRFLSFSILGLGVYVLAGLVLTLPPAIHVLPATYEAATIRSSSLPSIFLPYFGHILGSTLVGAAAACIHRLVCKLRRSSAHPSAWDDFLKVGSAKRWVTVALKSGDIYAGYIHMAEQSVPTAERDVILRSPAKYDEATRNYVVTSYRDLFLPADLIQNIGTIRSDAELLELPEVGTPLFPTVIDERNINSEDPASTTTEKVRGVSQRRFQSSTAALSTEGSAASATIERHKEVM
jgi:hypothetical protein